MSILLVRHGETALNAARVLQPADTPLSERGFAQARAVARRLASPRPAAILSSDLPRASQTAAAIAEAAGLPVSTTALLQERNFGDLRGLAYDSLGYDPLASEDAPPGGESVPQFRQRVAHALHAINVAWARAGGTLVVVTHGLVIRTLLEHHARFDDGVQAPERLENTSVTVVEPGRLLRVTLVNCTRHLDEAIRGDGRGLSGF